MPAAKTVYKHQTNKPSQIQLDTAVTEHTAEICIFRARIQAQ